jgi:hypothetical protein
MTFKKGEVRNGKVKSTAYSNKTLALMKREKEGRENKNQRDAFFDNVKTCSEKLNDILKLKRSLEKSEVDAGLHDELFMHHYAKVCEQNLLPFCAPFVETLVQSQMVQRKVEEFNSKPIEKKDIN